MAEPARKFEEIEPDIRPTSLKALNNQESTPEKPNTNSVAEQEANGSNVVRGPWANKVSGAEPSAAKPGGRFAMAKKKGPLAVIILTLFGGGIGIVGMLSPSLLLVQVKEIMVNKFNTQLSSMDVRTTKMLINKSGQRGTLKGLCGPVMTIRCKYGTMSKKQVKNFEKAGIEVISDGDTTLLGRIKPKRFKFEGQIIPPEKFTTMIRINSKFRTALKHAYNPKFAGFTDYIWAKTESFLHISKKEPTFEGKDYNEKMENLEKTVQDTTGLKTSANVTDEDVDPDSPDGKTYGEQGTTEATNNRINEFNSLIEETGGDGSASSKLLNGAEEVGNMMKITGVVDDGCTFYRTFRSIGYAAKTVRVMQLAYYSMMFLNVADQIKAGTAKEDDVSFLSTVLTKTSNDDNGAPKSATNSFGYNYAESGKVGVMPTSSMQFMSAAGLSGVMVNFFDSFPKSLKTTCRVLGNPIVGFASMLGGAALTVATGGASLSFTAARKSFTAAAKHALKSPGFWASTGLGFAEMFLPGLLKDIVAGNLVDKTTVGANAGDAITSGASGIMGTAAKTGGNAPLTPDQAIAYNGLTKEIANQYAEEDRLAHSPLDASNSNTFMGKIVGQLIPYTSNMSSLSSVLSSVVSITTGSFASLTPQAAKAASTNEYSMCQDYEYRKLNLATDPFCNVMYGIPPEALDGDPIEIASTLITAGQIDSETGDPVADSDYAKFVTNCIDRISPLGDDSSESEGSECLFNNTNKNYYVHYIDQRVQSGMDDEEPDSTEPTAPPNNNSQTAKELAQTIIDSHNVTDSSTGGQISKIAGGDSGIVDVRILRFLAGLAIDNTFTITSLRRYEVLSVGAGAGSPHLSGRAVDISGQINGVSVGYSDHNSTIQTFVNKGSSLLSTNCQVGLPNQSFVSGTTGSGCTKFVDIGTGPHIHFGVGA